MSNHSFFKQPVYWLDHATIPKTVYRTVPSLRDISPQISQNFRQLTDENPDWEQLIFDDVLQDQFVLTECSDRAIDAYFRLNPSYGPSRADLFRYLIIYQRGGVYLDQKSGVLSRLNDLIQSDDKFLLAPADPDGKRRSPHKKLRTWSGVEYMQWLIAASPGHPFLAAVIEEVLSNIHRYRPLRSGVGKRAVFYTTGPVAFTCAIAPIVTRYPHRKIDAVKEGWRYTVLNSAVDHHRFSSVHYSKLSSPVVLAPTGQSKVKKMLYVAESFIAALIGKISVINHDRIKRRRARRMPAR